MRSYYKAFFTVCLMSLNTVNAEQPKELPVVKNIVLSGSFKNVILSEAMDGKIYPAVIERHDGLEFLDLSGKRIKFVEFPKPYGNETINQVDYSKNQKFLVLHTTIRGEQVGKDDRITVYDISGNELWSTLAKYGSHYVAPNGEYVVCQFPGMGAPRYPPVFLNRNGIMNPKIYNFDFANSKQWYPRANIGSPVFSDDSSLVGVGISYPRSQRGGPVVFFNNRGEILFTLDIQMAARSIVLSSDNKYLIVGGRRFSDNSSRVQLWDLDAKKMAWEGTPLPNAQYHLAFTETSNGIVAASMRLNTVYFFDVKTGKLVWEFSDPDLATFGFNSLSTSNKHIVLSGEGARVIVLDEQGNRVGSKIFEKEGILLYRGDHAVSLSDGKVRVVTESGFKVLDIPTK